MNFPDPNAVAIQPADPTVIGNQIEAVLRFLFAAGFGWRTFRLNGKCRRLAAMWAVGFVAFSISTIRNGHPIGDWTGHGRVRHQPVQPNRRKPNRMTDPSNKNLLTELPSGTCVGDRDIDQFAKMSESPDALKMAYVWNG